MLKGVLFDMDGVLINSEYLTTEAAIRFFAEKGFTVTHSDFYPFYGTGEKGYFMGVANKYGIPFNLESDKIKIYNLFKEMAQGKDLAIPGVSDFIGLCKSKKLALAVATSAGSYKMNINLELLQMQSGVFDALVSGEDITNNKPHPEIFLKAAEKLGLQPNECLVIEDAPSGVKAAKAAGCKCLALRTTFGSEDLKEADEIIKDLKLNEIPLNIFN
jgi:HAD superfamily hydrolase (TIGR01509 family)